MRFNGSSQRPIWRLPIFDWARDYTAPTFGDDILAATIVTIMLIPQSLAYATIAGLPPEAGLYASITPLLAYTLLGTSRTLSVGPVAVISLMTAAAIGRVVQAGEVGYATAALTLAFLTGGMLLTLGFLRLGLLANFLSRPIISGFISASGLLIATSQLAPLIGVTTQGHTLLSIMSSLTPKLGDANLPTTLIGAGAITFLVATRSWLEAILVKLWHRPRLASSLVKAAPLAAVILTTSIVSAFDLSSAGVDIVGNIPKGLPPFTLPPFDLELWKTLALPALLIAIIGFVESVSVAQTLAAKRRERIDLNQELIGLGAANIAASASGGFPVTGGFSRSVVNFDAGAKTPAASAFAAAGILSAALFFTPLLYNLPKATLAATIIIAVLSLVDLSALKRIWRYSKSDFAAMAVTIFGVFLFGVETGVIAGIALSIGLFLYKTSRPHCAIVGQIEGTEHFRNTDRYDVITSKTVVSIRIDGSLYFANARFLEDKILGLAADHPELNHVVLMCSAINEIDASALESLEVINERLTHAGVVFHLSEIKGPVMDQLQRSHFLEVLSGRIFLSQFEAMRSLAPDIFKENGNLLASITSIRAPIGAPTGDEEKNNSKSEQGFDPSQI